MQKQHIRLQRNILQMENLYDVLEDELPRLQLTIRPMPKKDLKIKVLNIADVLSK